MKLRIIENLYNIVSKYVLFVSENICKYTIYKLLHIKYFIKCTL